MKFMSFVICLWLLTLFYSWEHRLYCAQARAACRRLLQEDALGGTDWRIVAREGNRVFLRRAFHVASLQDALRYGVPVATLAAFMIVWHNWALAALYGAAIALKWFVCTTVIVLQGADSRIEARLFGLRLFREDL